RGKQIEIAAKIEHAGGAGAEQEKPQIVWTVLKGGNDAALPGVKIFKEIEVIAGPAPRPHESPQRAGRVVPGNFQLLQFEQSAGVGALFQINQLQIDR